LPFIVLAVWLLLLLLLPVQTFKDGLRLPLHRVGGGIASDGSEAGSSLRSAPVIGSAASDRGVAARLWRWASGRCAAAAAADLSLQCLESAAIGCCLVILEPMAHVWLPCADDFCGRHEARRRHRCHAVRMMELPACKIC
jgi:hypothetical protein